MHQGKYRQTLSISVKAKDAETCLKITNHIKKQCEAWAFCVTYTEHKSARKGPVLGRELLIYQLAFAHDIIVFREALRRLCEHYEIFGGFAHFNDRGTIPETSRELSGLYPISQHER
ncbi:MAG: hypothetical protein JNL60_01930 [Bacteroidia bacterium]|nr:hypothetical protein [Bacteroidia bacterium]